MPHPPRQIIHLDMDAFYASVEMLDNPDLTGKPVIVGGTGSRGVVSAASYGARKFGVHSALSVVIARKRCPQGIFLPVRMDRYREVSAGIMAIFRRYTPLVEPLSLDEAFLDVTGCEKMFGPAAEIAAEIRRRVREEIGLTVSAGVAGSKLVAKIASDQNKPDGLTVVEAGKEEEFLAPLPITRLWGVGKKMRDKLALLGVRTIGDLAALDRALLERLFGRTGVDISLCARGIDDRPVQPEHTVKSIGNEETFDEDIMEVADLKKELLFLSCKVGARLRRHGLAGKTVTLKVKYFDFSLISRARTLPQPTDDDRTIYRTVCGLLDRTAAGRKPVRLAGVTVSNFRTGDNFRQLCLFPDTSAKAKRTDLNLAVDLINEKYGSRTILPATLYGPEEDQ